MAPPATARLTDRPEGMTVLLQTLLDLVKRRAESLEAVELLSNGGHGSDSAELKRLRANKKPIESALYPFAEMYSRAWNFGFANNIAHHLPRELRDMISKELVFLHRPGNAGSEDIVRGMRSYGHTKPTKEHGPITIGDYPHFYDHTFMGSHFVTELSTVYHAHRRFDLQHPIELEGFLKMDRFQSACIPSEHVRSIKVEVTLDSFNLASGNFRAWQSPKYRVPMRQHYKKSLECLYDLRSVQVKRGSKITLRVICKTEDAAPKFAELLCPWVYDMKELGWAVEVVKRFAGRDTRSSIFNYDAPRAEWEKKIKDNSAFSNDDEAAATRPEFLARMENK